LCLEDYQYKSVLGCCLYIRKYEKLQIQHWWATDCMLSLTLVFVQIFAFYKLHVYTYHFQTFEGSNILSLIVIVRVGQNFTFMCRVGKPLLYCTIQVPGYDSLFITNENTPRNNSYSYSSDGLAAGQCGFTITRIDDKQNGQFNCLMVVSYSQVDLVGVTNITVASKN
jgi:hypothetical protein